MNKNETIEIFRPGKRFPAVSITGQRCQLMCDHCRGEHLKGMTDASVPSDLLSEARRIVSEGGTGMLISGGCDTEGKVPLANVSSTISKIGEMGLAINVHSGFLTEEEASRLVRAGVARFSVDVHQDPEVIRNVLHLDVGPEEYENTISNILVSGGVPVPHVAAGFGTIDLVSSAEMVKNAGINDIILLGLVATNGTETENTSEEGMLSAIDILMETGLDVTLGCMRPRNYPGLEIKAIERGVRRIANPSMRTVRWAEDNGYRLVSRDMCCAMGISSENWLL